MNRRRRRRATSGGAGFAGAGAGSIRLSRIFWIGAAAILVAAALVALFAVLRGDFSDTDGRILGTLAALLLAGSTSSPASL